MKDNRYLKDFAEGTKPSYYQSANTATSPLSNTPYYPTEDTVNYPEFKVTSKKPYKGEIVTRALVWDYYRTQLALPNDSDILQKLGKNIEEIDQLLCDARVKAAFNNRRSGSLSLKWTIDENNSPIRVTKLVEKIFETLPVYDIMSEMMTAIFYGYNVSEVVWEPKNGLILPTNVQGKAQRWFVYSDKNELRVKSKVEQVQGERLPPRKFIVTRFHPQHDDPYAGREALFNACYWPVIFRKIIFQYSMAFLEKYGMPWFDVTVEGGLQEERLNEIVNVINQTYQNGILAHPDNTKIAKIDMSDAKTIENYTQMLDLLNREIDVAILGNNLSVEVKGGSYAAANAHMGIRDDIIKEDIRMLESSMNQLIEWIAWFNFGANINLPKFRMYKSEPPTIERSNIDINLAKLGIKFNKAYISRVYGINEDEFDVGIPLQMPKIGETVPGATPTGPGNGAVQTDNVKDDSNKTGISDQEAEEVSDSGIEAKDQASNEVTNEEILHMQKKGYTFSEDQKGCMIFLRHGSTGYNTNGDKIRGWYNVQLNQQGLDEANKAAEEIGRDHKIDMIVSSDLDRALDTAKIVSAKTGNPKIVATKNLRPWNLGVYTGKHSAEVAPEIQQYIQDPDKTVPEGESFNSFKDRFLNEIQRIKRELPGKRILIVAHHRNDRLLKSWEACGNNAQNEISSSVMAQRAGVKPGEHRELKL